MGEYESGAGSNLLSHHTVGYSSLVSGMSYSEYCTLNIQNLQEE